MKGLTIRNTHVKYESRSIYQSKVMTQIKVLLTDRQTDGKTDGQTDYYRAPAISGALMKLLINAKVLRFINCYHGNVGNPESSFLKVNKLSLKC